MYVCTYVFVYMCVYAWMHAAIHGGVVPVAVAGILDRNRANKRGDRIKKGVMERDQVAGCGYIDQRERK